MDNIIEGFEEEKQIGSEPQIDDVFEGFEDNKTPGTETAQEEHMPSSASLDGYEDEVELAEAFTQGRLNRYLDVKAGRQIVVWGRSDNIRITDVLNPLYLREPGLTDIEDLRLPVAMTRLDGYWAEWNLSAIALHEIRFGKSPAFGHDFFPAQAPPPDENNPGCGGSNTEWALALSGIFSGKDISIYWTDCSALSTPAGVKPLSRWIGRCGTSLTLTAGWHRHLIMPRKMNSSRRCGSPGTI